MHSSVGFIDLMIVGIYLLVTLVVGIKSGLGSSKSMKDYALGGKNFTTTSIIATIVATKVGGNSVMGLIKEIYSQGWIFGLVLIVGHITNLIFVKHILIGRINNFAGCYSIGDMIKQIFGDKSQIIVGIFSVLMGVCGIMGQVLALGFAFNLLLGIDTITGILIGSFIVITYSYFGGVKAVITTDVIQFALLVIAIPMVLNFTISDLGDYGEFFARAPAINIPDNKSISYYTILPISFFIPQLYPATVQRYLITKDSNQLRTSLNFTMIAVIFIYGSIILIGISSSILYPESAHAPHMFAYLIQELIPTGLKGVIIAGLLAVIMSTADTILNTSSVCFSP